MLQGGTSVMTRTDARGGSRKLQRELARNVAREATAARRRGVALSAAGGVNEEEWAAAVRLGTAAAPAKAFLFGRYSVAGPTAPAGPAFSSVAGPTASAGPAFSSVAGPTAPAGPAFSSVAGPTAPAGPAVSASPSGVAQCIGSSSCAAVAMSEAPAAGGARTSRRQREQARSALAAVSAAVDRSTPARACRRGGSGKAVAASAVLNATAVPAAAPTTAPACSKGKAAAAAAAAAVSLPLMRTGVCGIASNNDELQARIAAALPPRGSFSERTGAAGTPADQQRESPIVEVSLLLAEAVLHGLRTIAFCKSRKLCELVCGYTRENLKACAPGLAGAVRVYRGGYSAAQRRQLEADLHSGALVRVEQHCIACAEAYSCVLHLTDYSCILHLKDYSCILHLKDCSPLVSALPSFLSNSHTPFVLVTAGGGIACLIMVETTLLVTTHVRSLHCTDAQHCCCRRTDCRCCHKCTRAGHRRGFPGPDAASWVPWQCGIPVAAGGPCWTAQVCAQTD
jgi:hypothetical protein